MQNTADRLRVIALSSHLCSLDLSVGVTRRRLLMFGCWKKHRQRIDDAAFRPAHAESRPWMACGGEPGMDEYGLLARHCRAPVLMPGALRRAGGAAQRRDRKSTRLNSSH